MATAGHGILCVPCFQQVGWEKNKEKEMGKSECSHPLGDSHIIKFKMNHDDAEELLFSGSICGEPGRREGFGFPPSAPQQAEMRCEGWGRERS